MLPAKWRESKDVALATAGDSTGFHLLTAEAATGYQWRTLATLREPGLDTDQWIGNACLTGSGNSAVAVYAPRHFTNREELFNRGGFAAVVDLRSGEVTKLRDQVSLSYFNPGCGAGERVVLTQGAVERHDSTRLLVLNAAERKVTTRIQAPGQVTSAIPVRDRVVAAAGGRLVEVSGSGVRTLVTTGSVPFDLRADDDGGVVFAERAGERVEVRYHRAGSARLLATGRLGRLSVETGTRGRLFLLGDAERVRDLPASVTHLASAPARSEVSSEGGLAVTSAAPDVRADAAALKDTGISGTGIGKTEPEPVRIAAQVTATRAEVGFTVQPDVSAAPQASTGTRINPRLAAEGTVDAGHTCAVPRNDPTVQVYQPHWRQVEWAVNQLVFKNRLTLARPANWKGSGLPSWSPAAMFPIEDLRGGGRVPSTIMLGVLAQESNLWQAQRNAAEGEPGNPLVGNYYGLDLYDNDPGNDWDIDFTKADCGYGISQQTDGMRKAGSERPGETAWPPDKQRAVALDYATNIAAGLRTLTQKWNQIWDDTGGAVKANTGNPAKIENWYFALWAYNSGWHPKAEAPANGGAWGVGWANNPANPAYRPDRHPFLDNNTYSDAAHPQDWPYQEKVLGWAAWPIVKSYYDAAQQKWLDQAGYNYAWWNTVTDRSQIVPTVNAGTSFAVDINAFCRASGTDHNDCQPGASVPGASTPGTCRRADFKCWWHLPKLWKVNCDTTCGNEGTIRYSDPEWAYTERADPTDHWTPCRTPGLPSGAYIIDDVPSTVPAIRGGCDNSGWANSGSLGFEFGRDAQGRVPAKADFGQIGNGFGGHYWYGFTRSPDHNGEVFKVSGTWTLNRSVNGPANVWVHLPAKLGYTKHAKYEVQTAQGLRTRTISQRGDGRTNRWVSIGAFQFAGPPVIRLSTLDSSGDGKESIVWDVVAVQPVSGTFAEHTVEAVALFDEDQDVDSAPPASDFPTPLRSRQALYDWGIETSSAVTSLPDCSGGPTMLCTMPGIKAAMGRWHTDVVAAGTDPVDHPDGKSIATWIGFANPYTDRPTSPAKPPWYDTNDGTYKIRSKVSISFVKAADGTIVAGSEHGEYANRTGDTHLPRFVKDTFAALQADYGIAPPDLTYSTADLNSHDGVRRTARPHLTGILPGRAYAYAGKAPVAVDAAGNPTGTGGTCVAALYTSGGSIGYRPMLGADDGKPWEKAADWKARVEGDTRVPPEVAKVAGEIYNAFFNKGIIPGLGSIFGQGPPIWQELNLRVCTDGSVRKNGDRPLLRSSHMPDQYLYHNGQAMDLNGGQSNSAAPVVKGRFDRFSRIPDPNQTWPLWENPYGPCGPATGQSGNPWDISVPSDAGVNPSAARFCLDNSLQPDPAYSSP
ncbi:hypothetical protein DP939_40985 [Spongiactinospora rosea]|uniref:Golvesin/Xly CBD-like domain-containing protein n=1 Tax=Spongiactinospora rosea TaxID=2248750 RepID=A0A366LKA0_9ACTN|nr:hypothetical protein DP939_40985 [Spongiactinospora rosea]